MSVFDDLGLPDPSAKTQEKQDIFAELGLPKPESTKQNKGIAGDFGTDLKRGFLGIPGAVTGLIDIPVAAVTGRPMVSEGWQGIGELTGFQPGKWAKEAEAEYSPARQKAQREIDAAWENGTAGDISGAYASNPAKVAGSIIESLPSMLAGGIAGRAALGVGARGVSSAAGGVGPALPGTIARTVGEKFAPAVGAGIGEGGIMAGQSMSDLVEKGVDPRTAAGYAGATGVVGGALGAVGGNVAQRLGIIDPETAIAGGVMRATTDALGKQTIGQITKDTAKRAIGGGISEGLIEELPQSLVEQGLSNLAQGKPLTEDMTRAGVEGALAGFGMGAGFNAIPARRTQPPAEQTPPANPNVVEVPTATGSVPVDRTAGPISAAVHAGVSSDAIPTAQPVTDTTADPFERLATLELLSEQRDLTPQETAEANALSVQLDNESGAADRAAATAADVLGAQPAENNDTLNNQLDETSPVAPNVGTLDAAAAASNPIGAARASDQVPGATPSSAQAESDAKISAKNWDLANRTSRSQEWLAGAALSGPAFDSVSGEGSSVPAHGVAKAATLGQAIKDLVSMVRGGIDPSRTLYYDSLTNSRGGAGAGTGTAGGHAYRDGPFIITFREGLNGRQPTSADITGILVNPAHSELVAPLQSMFPNLAVRDYSGVADVVSASKAGGKSTPSAPATPSNKRKGAFASSNRFTVDTEDNGEFDATVHRTEDGSVVIVTDDGIIEYNKDFAAGKSDADLLAYSYEPVGFNKATAEKQQGAPIEQPAATTQETAPVGVERIMQTRTDQQLVNITTNEAANVKARQAATAEIQRRTTASAQQKTTEPLTQTATGSNIPQQAAKNIPTNPVANVQSEQANDAPKSVTKQGAAQGQRAATKQESIFVNSANDVNDLQDRPTGWKKVEYQNGDGVMLISYDGKQVAHFPSANVRSGTEGIRAAAKAHAYAIDNPYSFSENTPVGELIVKPIFGNSKQQAEGGKQQVEPKQKAAKKGVPVSQARDDIVVAILRATGGDGINTNMALDMVGDISSEAKKVSQAFTPRGQIDMDDLATLLRVEEQYDVRDGNHLKELLREHAAGNAVHSMGRVEKDAADNEVRKYREDIRKRASELGIKTNFRKFDAVEADVLATELKQAQDEEQAEREAIQAANEVSDETINELSQLAAQENDGRYINEEWITDEQILDAFEPVGENQEEQAAAGAGEVVAGQEGGGRDERGEAPQFDLAAQTPAELKALADQKKAAEDLARKEQLAAIRAERAAKNKAEKDRRAAEIVREREAKKKAEVDALAQNFDLGQAAPAAVDRRVDTEQARGQQDVFAQNRNADIAPGLQAVAQRQVNAQNRFIESVVEQFGLTEKEAGRAWDYFVENKLLKVDAVGGQYTLTNGDFWDADAIRMAARKGGRNAEKPAEQKQERGEAVEQKPAQEPQSAEQKIRAAMESGDQTIGKIKPITIEHNGVTQNFIGFIGNPPSLANQRKGLKTPFTLSRIKAGKMIASLPTQLLVENYTLNGRNVLEQVGNARVATEGDIKQWRDAGFAVPEIKPAQEASQKDQNKIPAKSFRDAERIAKEQGAGWTSENIERIDEEGYTVGEWFAVKKQEDKSGKPDPGRYVQPAINSSREGQMALADRAGRIATLKVTNDFVAKNNPSAAYSDSEIENAANDRIDAMMDWLIASQKEEAKPAAVDAKKEVEAKQVDASTLQSVNKSLDGLGIKHSIFENNGVITVSKIVVPEESRRGGIGTKAMQLLTDYADKTGQRIVLSPSADFGGNKTKLIGFYKRFGFVENKGRNKDFSTMESMYRDAKETDKGVALYSRASGETQDKYRGEPNETWTPDVALISASKKLFGTTVRPYEAGYVLPDGTMLDFTGRHETSKDNWPYMRDQRSVDHRMLFGENLDGFSIVDMLGSSDGNEAMHEFMARTGAMRVDFRSSVFSTMRPPSLSQLNVVSRSIGRDYAAASYVDGVTGRIIADTEWNNVGAAKIRDFFNSNKDKKPSANSPLFSVVGKDGNSQKPMPRQAAESVINRILGDKITKALIGAGLIRMVDSEAQIPGGGKLMTAYASSSPSDLVSNPSKIERLSDRMVSDSKNLADFVNTSTFIQKGFSGFDVPTKLAQLGRVGRLIENDKVRQAVVASIPVDMMNMLASQQLTPELLFNKPAMLRNLFSVDGDNFVSLPVDVASRLANVVAIAAAKVSKLPSLDGARSSLESNPATIADQGNPAGFATLNGAVNSDGASGPFFGNTEGLFTDTADNGLHDGLLDNNEFVIPVSERIATSNTFDDADIEITRKESNAGQVLGATMPDGTIYLNLGALNEGNIEGVFKHEGFHSAVRSWLGEQSYSALMKRLEQLRNVAQSKIAQGRALSAWYEKANAAIPQDTREQDKPEELAGYSIEMYANGTEQPSVIRKWVEDFLSALRTAIIKHMPNGKVKLWALNNLKPQDLARMAVAGMKAKAQGQLQAQAREAMAYSQSLPATINVDGIDRPTTNSNGKPIHPTEEGIRNFWKWFAGSKVVDAQGRPLVVYHSSLEDIERFNKTGQFMGHTGTSGISVTDNPEMANRYLDRYGTTRYDGKLFDKNMMVLYVKAENPLYRDEPFQTNLRLGAPLPSGYVSPAVRLGYDSLIRSDAISRKGIVKHSDAKNAVKGREIMVFSPEQIKSAIGNNGQFDPTNPDIRYSRSGNAPAQPANQPQPSGPWQQAKAKFNSLVSPEAIDTLIYNFQDKYVDLKNVIDRIKQMSGTITDLNDARLGEETYHSKAMKKTKDFTNNEIRPLLQQLLNSGIKKEDFEQYLHARHAPEANAVLAERNPNQQMIVAGQQKASADLKSLQSQLSAAQASGSATKSIEDAIKQANAELSRWSGAQAFQGTEAERNSLSGMSDQKAAQILSAVPAGKLAAMQSAAAKVDAIQAKTLVELEKMGLMDKASLDAWRTTYQNYVPLHRDEAHPDGASHPVGQGFSVKGDASKRRVGSNEKVTNILGHIAMQREAAIVRGEKNSVSKRMYLLAKQNPIRDFWQVDRPPMIETIDSRTGFVRRQVDPNYKNKPNVLMVRIAGKDAAIVFNEHNPEAVRLAGALKNLDGQDLDVVERTIGSATRWIASVNTQYNPIFGLINFARDVQTGVLNLTSTDLKDKKAAVWKETMRLFKEITKAGFNLDNLNATDKALWNDFQDNGGATGYRDMFANPEDRAKALEKELNALGRSNSVKRVFAVADWLSNYNESMENVVRMSAYKVGLQSGMSKERAASLAKNLTVNFNRKGSKAQKLGAFYAFFNASVQGTARMAQTLKGPVGKKIIIGGIALGVMQQMLGMLFMGGGDDDEWDKIPDFVKERSMIFPTGKDTYVSIPMPLGFNVLPNIGRLMTEWAVGGQDKPTAKQIGKLFNIMLSSLNPVGGNDLVDVMSPTVSDPVVSLLRNKDWTGKPIYREDMAGLDPTPGFTRTKDTATPWAKGMSYVVNMATGGTNYQPGAVSWTPDMIDYVIGQLTGGAGREIGKFAQTISAPFSGDELPMHKVPLVGRVVGSTAGVSGQSERFYENIKTLNGIEREIKGLAKTGEDVDSYIAGEPKSLLVGLANASESQVKKLREAQRTLKKEGDTAGAKELDVAVAGIMKGLNAEVRAANR